MTTPSRFTLKTALPILVVAIAGLLLLALLFVDRHTANRMLPHGYCYTWQPGLLSAHVISDALIGLAYISIPVTLMTIVRRRSDISFSWIVVLFAVFIISCGFTHWVEIWTVWSPDYWTSALVKVVTAIASIGTAVALVMLLPTLVALPTTTLLEGEIAARAQAEADLRSERDLLEQRVSERTAELATAQALADQARMRAEAANVAKDRFIASVSHELRTPLQAILGWTQVLGMNKNLTPEIKHAVDRLKSNVDAQARLINDLLDISRILSGKLSIQTELIESRIVVTKAIDSVQHVADERGIRLEADLDACNTVNTDAQRLQQVLWNLLINAINASDNGGKVHVHCHCEGGVLCINVQDWGVGIAPRDLENVFEAFRQNDRKRSHGGLGLGLAISRNIMQLLGGRLYAKSEGPGRGAAFSVELPLAPGPLLAESKDAPASELPAHVKDGLNGKRVLYVEDDVDILDAQAQLLRSIGMRVLTAYTFEEGQRLLAQGGFDVLVSDVQLGSEHTGYDLVRELRAAKSSIAAIAVSAYGRKDDIETSRAAGFDDHLTKPIDSMTLARTMAQLLDRRG